MSTSKKRIAEIERKIEKGFLTWSLAVLAIVLIAGLVILFVKG